jgi:methyl-accepting chemotaxis protein
MLFGISEWLSYRQTSALLEQHEAILIGTTDHNLALAQLQETKGEMFSRVTMMRILHAVLTLIAAVAALNYVWYKLVFVPVKRLQSQINIMGRGTWHATVDVEGTDEISSLAVAFNQLGSQLATTVRHINTSSQLSAIALMGNRIIRQINIARGQIIAAVEMLKKTDRKALPEIEGVTATLEGASASLGSIERHFETAFERHLQKVTAQFQDNTKDSAGESDEKSTRQLTSS